MARSETEVTNAAMRIIGKLMIADPDEDSEEARQSRDIFADTVREELEKHPWTFAKKRAVLPADADAPLFGFARSFTLPSDCARLLDVNGVWAFFGPRGPDAAAQPAYDINGRAVLCDFDAPLQITYVSVPGGPGEWTALFSAVVSAALAVKLAYGLTKSETIVERAVASYRLAVAEARKHNAFELPPRTKADGSWITARAY